ITQVADMRTCLRRIHASIQHQLGFDRIGLWLYDVESQMMHSAFGTDRAGQLLDEFGLTLPTAENIIVRAVVERPDSFFFVDDYETAFGPEIAPVMAGVKQHAAVAAWAGNKPVAIISVDNLITQQPITEEHLEALRLFASYAGLAIENSRLLE